jgi:hypothetical protein
MYHKHSGGAIADIAGSGGNGAPPSGAEVTPLNAIIQSQGTNPNAAGVAVIMVTPN